METDAYDPTTDAFARDPKPGIYQNVPFESYLRWNAVSNSRLSLAERSLKHFRYCRFDKQSNAMRFGSLTHCGQLEPLSVARRYAVMPAFHAMPENVTADGSPTQSKNTTWYRKKVLDFTAANIGKTVVDEAVYMEMEQVVTALCESERARYYLGNPGPVEVSIVWVDPETGLTCKARIDKITTAQGCLSDLKTTVCARKFAWSICDWGYHRQMALYQRGWLILTGEKLTPALVAVESSQPYCVRAAPLSLEFLQTGHAEVSMLLQKVEEATESDEWPGYPDPECWEQPERYGTKAPVELVVGGETISI